MWRNSITVKVINTLSNLTSGNSGLFFENLTFGTNSGWIQNYSWTSGGLEPSNSFDFRVKARNGDGIETSYSSIYSFSTLEEKIIPPPEEEIPPEEIPPEEEIPPVPPVPPAPPFVPPPVPPTPQ